MTTSTSGPGEITPGTLYKLTTAQGIIGVGKAGFRTMRHNGLPVKYLGTTAFVLGRDLIDHVMSHGRANKADSSN